MRTIGSLSALCAAVIYMAATQAGCSAEPGATPALAGASHPLSTKRSKHFVGLDEDVTFVNGPAKYVVRADGRKMFQTDLYAEERAARRRKFGALAPALAAAIADMPPATMHDVVVYFDASIDWRGPAGSVHSRDAALKKKAESAIRTSIASMRPSIADAIKASGASIVRAAASMPAVFARATRGQLQSIARMKGIVLVENAAPSAPRYFSAPNSATFHYTDTAFNSAGLFGDDVPVAIVEAPAECGFFEDHEAFSEVGGGVVNAVPAKSCSSASECPCSSDKRECLSGKCVQRHASQGASTAAAFKDGAPWAGARVKLFNPNVSGAVACSPSGISEAYDWLAKQEVHITSEAWDCAGQPETGRVQDWHARYFNTTVFKSAGNIKDDFACPNTLNAICVGGVNSAGNALWSGYDEFGILRESSWVNPTGTDREEPDVMALGQGVQVHDIGATNAWTTNEGTSFSAPAMAGLAGVLKQFCGWDVDSRWMRAMYRTSGIYRNVTHWRYSTPVDGVDHLDGGGIVDARILKLWCDPDPPPGGNVEVAGGVEPIDVEFAIAPPSYVFVTDVGTPWGDSPTLATPEPGKPGSGRKGRKLFEKYFSQNQKFAATISWDSCAVDREGSDVSAVATDYDLFFCNEYIQECIYSSQSFDDANEGFNLVVPFNGTWELWIVWDEGSKGCNGDTVDPVGWAGVTY